MFELSIDLHNKSSRLRIAGTVSLRELDHLGIYRTVTNPSLINFVCVGTQRTYAQNDIHMCTYACTQSERESL